MKKIILLMFTAFIVWSVSAQSAQEMNKKERHIVSIAALTGKGDLVRLKPALSEGLDAGMTVNEIREVLVHTYAYCGFPRALRGLQTFVAVLDERKAQGFEDKQGREASPVTDSRTRYERGRDILAEISGTPADAPKADYAVLAPEIERFLKEHLFADLFERDVLTYAEREIATVSVLAATGGVEPMVRSHMNISFHVGITPGQLRDLLSIVESQIGRSEADAGRMVLNGILQDKGLLTDSAKPAVEVDRSYKEANKEANKVRLSKIVVDPMQLDEYNAYLKEEIEMSMNLEPGVLTLYATSEKEQPNRITILEIYADEQAYQSHIKTPHFLKYKQGTLNMVQQLELIDTHPLIEGLKIK